jgi:antibiotic biosynthesis monooxygenase (ABM) superfamily enzyme
MWVQLIKTRIKPGEDAALLGIHEQLRAIEQPDSGLLRTTVMRDQKDPEIVYTMVVFESEEKARAREQDPRRRDGLQAVNAAMTGVLDGPPEFVDLIVIEESIR